MTYELQYPKWLKKSGEPFFLLREGIKQPAYHLNIAYEAWSKANENEQKRFLKPLMQTDAFVSALIYREFKDRIESSAPDQDKLKTLKSKLDKLNF